MTLPATEAFTDTNGVQLTTHSASWTLNSGDFDIQSNGFANDGVTGSTYEAAHWNADTFNANQYSKIVVVADQVGTWNYVGPSVRCATSANTFYCFTGQANECWLTKVVAGTPTNLGAAAAAFAVNDVIRLEANGTTITPLKNGSTTGTPGAQTDSSISSGYAGIAGFYYTDGSRTNHRGDSWEGGNLSGSPYTMTATQQNYTLGGQASNLLRGRVVSAAQQSYTLNRQAANLLRGRVISAAQQSYTLGGQITLLEYGRKVLAAAQSYALTLEPAALVYGPVGSRTMLAAFASFSVTPEASNLLHGRVVSAVQRTYALTLETANLLEARRLVAAQQVYALTGEPANLAMGRLLVATQRSHLLSGQAVSFLFTYRMAVVQAVFVLVGVNAGLVNSAAQGWSITDAGGPTGAGSIADGPAEGHWEVS